MGNDLQKGTTYAEGGVGGAGTVNADNLNAHVDEARIKASFVSSKTLRDPASLSDSFVVEAGGVLYRETFQQAIDLISAAITIPVGVIMDFAGASPPGGWLMCFGQTVVRTTYQELFDVIGVTYGAGSGDGLTFSLPDLRGRVAAGKDDMGGTPANRLTSTWGVNGLTLGAAGGAESHLLTTAQMPSHQHTYSTITGSGSVGITSGANSLANTNSGATGGGAAHPNVQPTVVVNKIIRYQ